VSLYHRASLLRLVWRLGHNVFSSRDSVKIALKDIIVSQLMRYDPMENLACRQESFRGKFLERYFLLRNTFL
jgi:hypothetical protein